MFLSSNVEIVRKKLPIAVGLTEKKSCDIKSDICLVRIQYKCVEILHTWCAVLKRYI